jgi:hypothetical protein
LISTIYRFDETKLQNRSIVGRQAHANEVRVGPLGQVCGFWTGDVSAVTSNGRLQDVNHQAAAAPPDLVWRLEDAGKTSLRWPFSLVVSNGYGFFSAITPEVVARAPARDRKCALLRRH